MRTAIASGVLLVLLAFPSIYCQQDPASTVWTRTAFEAGVVYQKTDNVAVTTTNCGAPGKAADSYSRSISWSTGAVAVPAMSGVAHSSVYYNGQTRVVVPNGTYPAFARDSDPPPTAAPPYGASFAGQTTTATVKLNLHCLDWTSSVEYDSPQKITIYDRNIVSGVIAPSSVRGGEPLVIEIIATDDAPPANSRIDLNWQGKGARLIGPHPNYVDIPSGTKSVKLSVQTLANTGTPKQLTVIATGKPGISRQAMITITK